MLNIIFASIFPYKIFMIQKDFSVLLHVSVLKVTVQCHQRMHPLTVLLHFFSLLPPVKPIQMIKHD